MEWDLEAKNLLDELVQPIPVFVRPMAQKKIESFILKGTDNGRVTINDVVRGYLEASSGDMKDKAIKVLKAKGIEIPS